MNVREYEMDDEWAYGGYRCNLTAANAGNALLENLVVSVCGGVYVHIHVYIFIHRTLPGTTPSWWDWESAHTWTTPRTLGCGKTPVCVCVCVYIYMCL
jgi:hypothetical protein